MASFGEQIIPTSAVKGGLEESLKSKLSIKELSLKVFMVVLLR